MDTKFIYQRNTKEEISATGVYFSLYTDDKDDMDKIEYIEERRDLAKYYRLSEGYGTDTEVLVDHFDVVQYVLSDLRDVNVVNYLIRGYEATKCKR